MKYMPTPPHLKLALSDVTLSGLSHRNLNHTPTPHTLLRHILTDTEFLKRGPIDKPGNIY
jgi:hypothetical protein